MSHSGPPFDGEPASPDDPVAAGDESPTEIRPARPTVVPDRPGHPGTAGPPVSLTKNDAPDTARPGTASPDAGPSTPDPYAVTQAGPIPPGGWPGVHSPAGPSNQMSPSNQMPPSGPFPSMPGAGGMPSGPFGQGWSGPPGMGPPGMGPAGMGPPAGPGGPPPYGWPPPQPRSNKTAYVLTGIALLCVLALVIGGVVWWKTSDSPEAERPELVAGQLTGSYPSAPTAVWTVGADDVGSDRFVSPLPMESMYLRQGAAHDDTTLVTLVHGTGGADGPPHLVMGIDVESGDRWIFNQRVSSCAENIVDATLACLGDGALHFVDTRSGRAQASVPVPRQAYGVATNSSAAYVRSYEGEGTVTFRKVTPAGVEWERSVALPESLPSGDSSQFIATDRLVLSAAGTVAVVAADDGREVLARPGRTGAGVLADGSILVVGGDFSNGTPTSGPVIHVHADGTTSELAGTNVSVPAVATPGQRDRVMIDGAYTNPFDGEKLWTASGLPPYEAPEIVVADDREVVWTTSEGIVAVDTTTGGQKWSAPTGRRSGSTGHAITDGEHLIAPTADGGLSALDLATGTPWWSMPATALGSVPAQDGSEPRPPSTFAVGDRLVTVTATTITGFAPTGPAAITPGASRGGDQDSDAGDGPTYVTPCGSPPTFTPESFRTSTGGLAVRMKVTAQCPGGDVLFGPQTRITITDDQGLVASGNFDFQRSPVAVPSLDDAGGALSLELTYPPGTFFRLPDTLSAQGSGSAGGSGPSGSGRYLVECDKGPTTGAPPQLSVPQAGASASSTSTGPSFPAGANIGASSVNALRVQADSDRAFILANLNNRWVAQLSSKRPGLVAEGRTWDDQAILDEFLALRLRFNDVRLLWSDEWPVFSDRGWWVTVAAATFPGPDEATGWCRSQGFTPDNCFAKFVSSTAGPDGTTRYWR